MSQTVRTRIAPSPTGDPHVGTAYIALFNLCFARQHGGQFILRIEDTDKTRSTTESEAHIFSALRWLGLDWDEGPDVGGEYGPYRQSERADSYKAYAEELVSNGHAFYCFRTPEELEAIRESRRQAGLNPGIKGDLELSAEEVQKRLAEGLPHVIRLKVPEEGVCQVNDMLRGTIEIDWAQVDSQILLKSDGMPTYHLANVVDDHLMEISHVIRGEEWINSAPKHQLLYEYFGWEMPTLCHLPLLRNPDKSKLSKRKNPTSVTYYKKMGFLPEAVVNFLGRMGWSMPDERERFELQEMIEAFDINRVSLGGPIFDVEKLRWLNGLWLREHMDENTFIESFKQWAFDEDKMKALAGLVQGRIETFSDVADMATFMFSGDLALKEEDFETLSLSLDTTKRVLQFMLWQLEQLEQWEKQHIFSIAKTTAELMDIKMGDFMAPMFLAIAGTKNSWSVIDSMTLLGPDITRARLRNAGMLLGGFSKKETKRVEKEYRALIDQINA